IDTDGCGTVRPFRVDGGPSFLEQVDALERQDEAADPEDAPQTAGASLPSVRRAGVAATEVEEAEEPVEEVTEDITDGPALQRFASEFENPDGSPVISVVLLHVGSQALGPDVLQALPAHVSFAVDANAANVSGTAQAYRNAGREVVLIPSLPAGAAPQDVEQAMQVNLSKVPEAVAIMDASGSTFQSDRAAVRQVVDVVSDTGHGLITFPRGLNTAHQEAQRANVPTGLIFRNVDGGGETQEQIRRTLDRAAFRARQNTGVILVGTTDDTTIAAIVEWALGNRAASVSIAPISVALGGSVGG
ncbi:MAG: divergent polysaccharide deacetylase family protein, partial [Pseudomonadota bacterium]